jgi:phosphodiesterase/alkaline phosphatase D-like protein
MKVFNDLCYADFRRAIALSGFLIWTLTAAEAVASDVDAPLMEQGIQIGDLAPGRAVVWSRTDRPAGADDGRICVQRTIRRGADD